MRSINLFWFSLLIGAFMFHSCEQQTQYQKALKKGLSSGERQDSIFFGLYFGMPAKDFYTYSWELNKKGLIREGYSNTTVHYDLEGLPYPAALEYYPVFVDDKIQSMTGHVFYNAWAPWNKDMFAEVLIEDVKNLFEDWYGKGFMLVNSPGYGRAYAKIDDNRQIALYYTKDERVEFVITDMSNDAGHLKFDSPK